MRSLQVHITSKLDQCEEDSSSTSTDDENEILAKKPMLLSFIAAGSEKRKHNNSVREVKRYFEKEIIRFDDDPKMYRVPQKSWAHFKSSFLLIYEW